MPEWEKIGKFIEIRRLPRSEGRKTVCWIVRSARSRAPLGVIAWRSGWRQYVLEPELHTVWSAGCLRDVAAFLDRVKGVRE